MSKEAMKLALDALEDLIPLCDPGFSVCYDVNKAITALREALAEQPAQQEPVARVDANDEGYWADILPDRTVKVGQLLYAEAPQPAQQEPVAWIVEDQSGERLEWASDAHSCHGVPTFPLYTSPPAQRKPLTDEEIIKCWGQVSGTRYGYVAFARAIEAAHGIKENT